MHVCGLKDQHVKAADPSLQGIRSSLRVCVNKEPDKRLEEVEAGSAQISV